MKIYLLDINPLMVRKGNYYFKDVADVKVVCADFKDFMNKVDVECIVSPANSYGLMDGGYDLAITKYFGTSLMKNVQKYIIDNYFGEQLVGTSFIIDIPKTNKKLIHTPSMRTPSVIKDPMVVYYCMRSALMEAIKNNISTIVIPAFGGACGEVDYDIIAMMMKEAYDQINNPPKKIDWQYASRHSLEDIE